MAQRITRIIVEKVVKGTPRLHLTKFYVEKVIPNTVAKQKKALIQIINN
jgi:hypothetical protein